MDPETGYPADSGLISVTVIGDEGAYCDALSTALFVMGEDAAVQLWRQRGDFEMILVRAKGDVVITPALRNAFTQTAGSDRDLVVIDDGQN